MVSGALVIVCPFPALYRKIESIGKISVVLGVMVVLTIRLDYFSQV
jgi:hypothetical protein